MIFELIASSRVSMRIGGDSISSLSTPIQEKATRRLMGFSSESYVVYKNTYDPKFNMTSNPQKTV